MVVARSVISLAAHGCRFDFFRERGGPLFPSEMPLLGELHRERKGLRLPWLGKHRPAFVARQLWQVGEIPSL